jgi:two-component sensor histidine kinase
VRWVSHTHEVRNCISEVLQNLTDAETAQRGYILTGDGNYLERIEAGRAQAERAVARVEALTADNRDQQGRIQALRTQMLQRMRTLDETVAHAKAGDRAGATAVLKRGEGIAAMDAVRRLVAELDHAESELERERTARAAAIRIVCIVTVVIFALLLGALFVKAVRDLTLDREVEAETAERLRELLRQRTLLLDEVNHRVKNSLQQIASVVRLQARSSADPAARDALEKTLARIMAVGRVHEEVYRNAGLVGAFDAGLYARNLARELVESMGRDDIRLATDIDSAMLDLKQAAPIALILNELITNALKYGCPPDRPCCIEVQFKPEGDLYRLRVRDEGEGTPPGLTTTSKSSLGLRAVDALARQLGGRFEIESPVAGAAFSVVFPRSTS